MDSSWLFNVAELALISMPPPVIMSSTIPISSAFIIAFTFTPRMLPANPTLTCERISASSMMVISDRNLSAPRASISASITIVVTPRVTIVNNNFMYPIEIVMSVSSWQTRSPYPSPIIIINITFCGYIIIHIIFRHIIITCIIISRRPPAWLTSNIDTYTNLCVSCPNCKKTRYYCRRVKQFFHK